MHVIKHETRNVTKVVNNPHLALFTTYPSNLKLKIVFTHPK